MGQQLWCNPLVSAQTDGPTLTAAAAATMLPLANGKITLPNNFFYVGKQLRITAAGRISCLVTTPGTARFDVRVAAVVAFDSLAMPLNILAKTNVGWTLEVLLTCRTVGNGVLTTLMGQGKWTSEASIGAPLAAAGAPGSFVLPYNTAPAVGTGFDNTTANSLDMFFTQTVATGSMTLHSYLVEEIG
jgi:hypothetical protein